MQPQGTQTKPFAHQPVLLEALLAWLSEHLPLAGVVVDCTLGGAGHAGALLERFTEGRLFGLDRDPVALKAARERLLKFGGRVRTQQANFGHLAACMAEWGLQGADLILADFGVSSHQLDEPSRGFSFRNDGPLDMRMNPEAGLSAAEWIAQTPQTNWRTCSIDTAKSASHDPSPERSRPVSRGPPLSCATQYTACCRGARVSIRPPAPFKRFELPSTMSSARSKAGSVRSPHC